MSQNWLAAEDALTGRALLTVQAQAVPPNDTGTLLWDEFFPREDVDSIDLDSVTTVDYRPTADRREWNAEGRLIPNPVPSRRKVSIVPIEARDKIGEKEMQRLNEQVQGNQDRLRQIMQVRIPERVTRLAEACYRRLEVDALRAWANGTIIQRSPEDASKTYTASFGFDTARINTAGTAWDNGGVNAYNLLQAWIVAAEDLVGPIEGAMLRLNTLNAILADAPNLPNAVTMTRSQLEDRIQQDKGGPFRLYVNENSVDIFDDGGLAYTRTKIWPAGKIAAIPQGKRIGSTAFAPVVRAMELVAEIPEAGVDERGVTVYYEWMSGGKQLEIEGQLNALPVPEEQRLYVTATGVA